MAYDIELVKIEDDLYAMKEVPLPDPLYMNLREFQHPYYTDRRSDYRDQSTEEKKSFNDERFYEENKIETAEPGFSPVNPAVKTYVMWLALFTSGLSLGLLIMCMDYLY
jgi:hypothetical protein